MSLFRSPTLRPALAALLCCAAGLPSFASAATSVRYELSSIDGSPFPSDHFTRADWRQLTGRRVALPMPDCAIQPSDCADVSLLNQLDGFNVQPRITVPFDGDIDPASVDSRSIFLVHLGDTLSGKGRGEKIGINQIVWDTASRTLAFESERQLDQHSRYLLVVTDGVRDARGKPIASGRFGRAVQGLDTKVLPGYLKSLIQARAQAGLGGRKVVALSLFTTRSVSADLQKVHRQLQRQPLAPVDFMLGERDGEAVRTVFPLASLSSIELHRQTGSAPSFSVAPVPTGALQVRPGAVGRVAFGRYRAPDYRNAQRVIPATPSLLGEPRAFGSHELVFEVFLPAGPMPAGGWPVVLFGHGLTDSMYGSPWAVAASFAEQGLATLAINAVGHGGGEQSQLRVRLADGGEVRLAAGGRSLDADGNGLITIAEGVSAPAPYGLLSHRDGVRQTSIDLMQLVRQVVQGIDVDGDGRVDLDAQRIYYGSQSFGAVYGLPLISVEPRIRAVATNVAGGSMTEAGRLGLARPSTGAYLALRQPSLINLADPSGVAFDENLPLRNQPVRTNQVPGAMAIQRVLDRSEWAQQSANPAAYAVHLRKRPLAGRPLRPLLFQFALGDQGTPNPTSSAILRAGELADRASLYRHDLAYASNPAVGKDPHSFLTSLANPALAPHALMAQRQMAQFLASDGRQLVDPDAGAPLFEVPPADLPEALNYIR